MSRVRDTPNCAKSSSSVWSNCRLLPVPAIASIWSVMSICTAWSCRAWMDWVLVTLCRKSSVMVSAPSLFRARPFRLTLATWVRVPLTSM